MSAQAKITIRVTSTRGGSNVQFSSTGSYVSTPMNGYNVALPGQAIQPTADQKTFWTSVLALVQAQIAANPSP
ncbi:MAG: hypothetical protein KGJ86_12140 [Chloroflexota bacterium]|nr:hypothetical protein [Chloroflexota bacterium]